MFGKPTAYWPKYWQNAINARRKHRGFSPQHKTDLREGGDSWRQGLEALELLFEKQAWEGKVSDNAVCQELFLNLLDDVQEPVSHVLEPRDSPRAPDFPLALHFQTTRPSGLFRWTKLRELGSGSALL